MLRTLLALALVLATVPLASAASAPAPEVRCDMDDDLYQHCNVGDVHTVYGPGCAGVAIGGPAACRPLVDALIA